MANARRSTIPELGHWRAYLALCKPKVVGLLVFTAIVGMLLAVPAMVPLQPLVLGTLGIALASAAAAALNHVVDREADARMKRTDRRRWCSPHWACSPSRPASTSSPRC
jgi:protoheme IX farnesyltransferase